MDGHHERELRRWDGQARRVHEVGVEHHTRPAELVPELVAERAAWPAEVDVGPDERLHPCARDAGAEGDDLDVGRGQVAREMDDVAPDAAGDRLEQLADVEAGPHMTLRYSSTMRAAVASQS